MAVDLGDPLRIEPLVVVFFDERIDESISLIFMVAKGGDQFTTEKLSAFVGKKVRVSGTVGTYHEALQIKIEKLDQIQIQP